MSANPREVVYVNGGAIYKAPTDADLGVAMSQMPLLTPYLVL